MDTVNWLTIKLSYKLKIFKLIYNAYNYILPSRLTEHILVNEVTVTCCEGARPRSSRDIKVDLRKIH